MKTTHHVRSLRMHCKNNKFSHLKTRSGQTASIETKSKNIFNTPISESRSYRFSYTFRRYKIKGEPDLVRIKLSIKNISCYIIGISRIPFLYYKKRLDYRTTKALIVFQWRKFKI